MDEAIWYYVDRSQQRIGPLLPSDVAEAHRVGAIDDASLVWREGLSGWEALGLHRDELGIPGPPDFVPANPAAYGAPPAHGPPAAKPSSKTLGCLLIGGAIGLGLVFVVAILAAIALPAYQDYVARSQLGAALAEIRAGVIAYEERIQAGDGGRASPEAIGLPGDSLRCSEIFTEGRFIDDGRVHRIACIMNGTPPVEGALLSLTRQSPGLWTCTVSDAALSKLPTGCESE
jgi:type IV pilus assembly protein PilA